MKRNLLLVLSLFAITITAKTETIAVATSEDLLAAFTTAESNDTILFSCDITYTGSAITSSKTLVLDLNGFTLTSSTTFTQNSPGVLTITGDGKIIGGTVGFAVYGGGLIVENGEIEVDNTSGRVMNIVGNTTDTLRTRPDYPVLVTISGGRLIGNGGIFIVGKGAVLNMTGGEIIGNSFGITSNGNLENGGIVMHLSGGSVSVPETNVAIYHPNWGNLVISDSASITGGTAVEMCSGNLMVNGGTLHGTASTTSGANEGAILDGAAVSIINRYGSKRKPYPGGEPHATVNGGMFVSDNYTAFEAYKWWGVTGQGFVRVDWEEAPDNVDITGGTFNTSFDVSLCAEGYMLKDNQDGTYTVIEEGILSGIDQYSGDTSNATTKQLRDGQLLIRRGGQLYSITGIQIQ